MIKFKTFVKQRKIRVGIVATVFVMIFAITVTAFAASTNTVNIYHDGTVTQIRTLKSEPVEILAQSKITVGEKDYVDVSSFSSSDESKITIYRVCTVSIKDGDESKTMTAVKDVAKTFEDNKIELRPLDKTSYELSELVFEGMEIKIERAFSVSVTADGKETDIETTPGIVSDALKLANITLDDNDEVEPSLTTELKVGMSIEVFRVDFKERTEREVIDYEIITKTNDKMYEGESTLDQQGKEGEKEVVYTDKYVNGIFSSAKEKSSTVITPAVEKIKTVGTLRKVTLRKGLSPISTLPVPSDLIVKNGVPSSYKRAVDATAFAYSGGGYTASGRKTQPGYIAVDPKQFPYGTELWIVSADGQYVYGYAIAADTGGFIHDYDSAVDLYMSTNDQCYDWGRRDVVIYVL